MDEVAIITTSLDYLLSTEADIRVHEHICSFSLATTERNSTVVTALNRMNNTNAVDITTSVEVFLHAVKQIPIAA